MSHFLPDEIVVRRAKLLARFTMLTLVVACGSRAGSVEDSAVGGSEGKEQAVATGERTSRPTCTNAETTPVGLAVRDYIGKARPIPRRFLSAAGTDSGVPDDGFQVLQDKGPAYFYSSDSVAQRKIREKLAIAGPYPSLLVVYRGQRTTNGGKSVDVRLGGHYIGGEQDGQTSLSSHYVIRCDATGWRIASTTEDSVP